MGWAAEDREIVERAHVDVSLTRVAAYKVIQRVKEIKHPEKGPMLVKLAEDLYNKLNEISQQLSR